MIAPQPETSQTIFPQVVEVLTTPGVGVVGGILSPVLPAGIRLPMPWGLFDHLNCIHCWTVVE